MIINNKSFELGEKSKEKEILEEILNICNRGNARQNQLSKFFEIKRLCQEKLLKLEKKYEH